MNFMWVYCLDQVQECWILAWVFDLWACFAVDLLWGKREVSSFGKLVLVELPVVMAFFAGWSAVLFPSTPLCVGTHLI